VNAGRVVPGAALSVLAVVFLGLAAHVMVLSQVRFERSQELAYADFRRELANATAPVGQVDADGQPHRPGTAVALLWIPALEARQVVFEGTSSGVLTDGPGHRRDTVLPGQAGTSVIMGRRAAYGGPFGNLDLLSTGDQITVVTGQGEHKYRVLGVRRAGDIAPPPLADGAGRLTLVTADGQPFMPQDVLRVDAELTSPVQPTPKRKFGASSLPPSEQALASEKDAWVPVVLWGQALLMAAFGVAWAKVRWGGWQAWVVGIPVLVALGATICDQIARLLPNLM
jgi:sortase A